jgi:1-acyl-sn-glycerol-3-phosphate acyltransferase
VTKIDTPLAGRSLFDRAAYQTMRFVVTTFCRIWCRMTIDGRENVPAHRAFLLAPVHRSILDTPISSGVTLRRMRYMGADKYWKFRPFGRLLSALGGFPVSRGTADREAIKRCIEVLEGGEPLVLFPEGERKSGSVVQQLFDGAAYIAVKAGVPILPVGIGGSERAMPKGSRFIRPRKVHVIVGELIEIPALADASPKSQRAAAREMTVQLHGSLQLLLDAAEAKAS